MQKPRTKRIHFASLTLGLIQNLVMIICQPHRILEKNEKKLKRWKHIMIFLWKLIQQRDKILDRSESMTWLSSFMHYSPPLQHGVVLIIPEIFIFPLWILLVRVKATDAVFTVLPLCSYFLILAICLRGAVPSVPIMLQHVWKSALMYCVCFQWKVK